MSRRVVLRDAASGKVLADRRWTGFAPFRAVAISFSPDGKRLPVPSRRIAFADARTLEVLPDETAHRHLVTKVAISPDGKFAVSGELGPTAFVWDLATGRAVRTIQRKEGWTDALSLSPDGRTLALAGSDSPLIELRDPATGVLAGELDTRRSSVESLAFSPDGATLLSTGDTGEVQVWDVATRRSKSEVPARDVASSAVSFSPDGKRFAQCFMNGDLTLHDLEQRSRPRDIAEAANSYWMAAAFSPDGRQIVMAGQSEPRRGPPVDLKSRLLDRLEKLIAGEPPEEDPPADMGRVDYHGPCHIRVVEVATSKVRPLNSHKFGAVRALAWSPDGTLIASSTQGWFTSAEKITLWSAATGNQLQEISGHSDAVGDLAFTPDGKRLLSASHDSTLLLWDLAPALTKLAAEHGPAVAP